MQRPAIFTPSTQPLPPDPLVLWVAAQLLLLQNGGSK
jgi:hypothetical protein